MTTTLSVPPPIRRPLSERFNLRILVFVAVFGFLIGFPAYVYLRSVLSGGIEQRGDYYEVDLKAMSVFPFDQENGKVEDVPQKWRDLDGKTVVLVGEMAPGTQRASETDQKFDLVYSVAKCCYSGTPQIQHFIKVTTPPTATVNYTGMGALQVRGKLRVQVTRDPETNKIDGVYHVVADRVESIAM
jgi:hypothetical protein